MSDSIGTFRSKNLSLDSRSSLGVTPFLGNTKSRSAWQSFTDAPRFFKNHPIVTGKLYTLYASKIKIGDYLFG
jgi:hypothetical protein